MSPRHNKRGRRKPNPQTVKWSLWRDMTRNQVGHAAGYICHYCGRKCKRNAAQSDPLSFTLDHLVPKCKGGGWSPRNLVCACRECNNAKGNMTAEEFMESRKEKLGLGENNEAI